MSRDGRETSTENVPEDPTRPVTSLSSKKADSIDSESIGRGPEAGVAVGLKLEILHGQHSEGESEMRKATAPSLSGLNLPILSRIALDVGMISSNASTSTL